MSIITTSMSRDNMSHCGVGGDVVGGVGEINWGGESEEFEETTDGDGLV